MLVDSHCHLDRLDLAAHDGSLDAALEAARQRGVGHFLCIGVSADNAADVKALNKCVRTIEKEYVQGPDGPQGIGP